MYVQVGSCPKCGAPIYSPSPYWSVTPPPAYHSCNCFSKPTYTTSNTLNVDTTTPNMFGTIQDKFFECLDSDRFRAIIRDIITEENDKEREKKSNN